MSQKQILATICDRCQKSDVLNGVTFVVPILVPINENIAILYDLEEFERLDMCDECDEAGCFLCSRCKTIHTHEAFCKYLLAEMSNPRLYPAAA